MVKSEYEQWTDLVEQNKTYSNKHLSIGSAVIAISGLSIVKTYTIASNTGLYNNHLGSAVIGTALTNSSGGYVLINVHT